MPAEEIDEMDRITAVRRCVVVLLIALCAGALAAPAGAQSAPAMPGAITLTRADGAVAASWEPVAGATKYHVAYSADGGASWHAPVNDNANVPTSSIGFSADNAKTYIVGVRAGNDAGWSGWRNSTPAGPYTPPAPLTKPAKPGAVTLTRADGTVAASWEPVAGATKYHVAYSADGGASWHAPVNDNANVPTSSIGFSADNAKTYIVGVRAGNDAGWSGWRNSAPAGPYTLPANPPPRARESRGERRRRRSNPFLGRSFRPVGHWLRVPCEPQ